ncbi:MAG: GntG family PLP-dependent aldolase [Bacteroidota bacterium]|nr:GntG family PLP-dependent aldolase [Bacteroidota bacterium]
MAEAEVGDDVFSEDPTVQALEEEVAALLGKEAALYVPTGCMANQLALNIQTTEGDEVILEYDSHVFNYETTAASFLSRVQLHPVKAADLGRLVVDEVKPAVRETAYYMPVTRLLALENTHNRAGGTVYPVEQVKALSGFAHANNIRMHLDGARLWNACAYAGVEPIEYAKHFDTVSVCFSKGLGAPVGSAVVSSKEMIAKARRMRKIWGGGMRQAGIIAAGALYALRNNRSRISEDHEKARRFAEIIASDAKNVYIDMSRVQTNIILLGVNGKAAGDAELAKLSERGVRLSMGSHGLLRAITHLDVSLVECEQAARTIVEVLG